MATSNLPAPSLQTLQPVPDEQNLLAAVSESGSCCGGGSCGTN